MAVTECENGHLFDNALHIVCPYCNGGIYRVDFGGDSDNQIGATVLLEDEPAGFSDVWEHDSDIGKTVLLDEEPEGSPRLSPGGSFPGRLVCTEGPDKGKTIILEPGETVDIKGGRYVYLS